jgi:hypothetical protein
VDRGRAVGGDVCPGDLAVVVDAVGQGETPGRGSVGGGLSRDDASLALILTTVVQGAPRNGTGTGSTLNLLLKPHLTITL